MYDFSWIYQLASYRSLSNLKKPLCTESLGQRPLSTVCSSYSGDKPHGVEVRSGSLNNILIPLKSMDLPSHWKHTHVWLFTLFILLWLFRQASFKRSQPFLIKWIILRKHIGITLQRKPNLTPITLLNTMSKLFYHQVTSLYSGMCIRLSKCLVFQMHRIFRDQPPRQTPMCRRRELSFLQDATQTNTTLTCRPTRRGIPHLHRRYPSSSFFSLGYVQNVKY